MFEAISGESGLSDFVTLIKINTVETEDTVMETQQSVLPLKNTLIEDNHISLQRIENIENLYSLILFIVCISVIFNIVSSLIIIRLLSIRKE